MFEHSIHSSTNGVENIVASPYANELLMEFAKAAVEGEQLGRSQHPDVLTVSFSANDAVGHKFGPYSREVQDLTLRLDRQLASLFEYLDEQVGYDNLMIVLTADHGVAPTPEFAAAEGLDGKRYNEKEFLTNVVKQLNGRFGEGSYLQTTNFSNGNLYLNSSTLERKGLSANAVTSFIRDTPWTPGFIRLSFRVSRS